MSDVERLLKDRRRVAEQMYTTEAGREFIYYLLEDMHFFDPVVEDPEIIMRNFARDMLETYFGVMVNNRGHRSFIAEAIIGAPKPEETEDE